MMFETRTTDEKLDLWMDGFEPTQHGWTRLGAADGSGGLMAAVECVERGIEVETFVSPMGKLAFYANESIEEVYGPEVEQVRLTTAGDRPPKERGAGAPA